MVISGENIMESLIVFVIVFYSVKLLNYLLTVLGGSL